MTFPGPERHHARFVAEYSDEIVAEVRRLSAGSAENDERLRELLALVHELSAMRTPAPAGLRSEIRQRLVAAPPEPPARWVAFRASVASAMTSVRAFAGARRVPGTVSIALLAIVTAAIFFTQPPALSAAEVLSRADRALSALVADGSVLHRQMLVASTTLRGGATIQADQVVDEWVDGGSQRLAARGVRPDGVLLWRYAAVPTPAGPRPHLYLGPAYGAEHAIRETGEMMVIRPTHQELRAALAAETRAGRRTLERFFTRGYIYEPIMGELRYNSLLLDGEPLDGVLKPVSLSMSETNDETGVAIYRVRVVEPTRLWFHWGRTGPSVQIAACETVLDISRSGLFTRRASQSCQTRDGALVTVERIVRHLEVLSRSALPADAFDLALDPDVPVRLQHAADEIAVFAAALETAAATSHSLPSQ